MKAGDAHTLRERVADLLSQGLSTTQVAKAAGCSRKTVYRVAAVLTDPSRTLADGRRTHSARPQLYETWIWDLVRRLREENPLLGPRMLAARMYRDRQQLGVNDDDIPSPATIARFINKAGLAQKPVGPRDMRSYPDERPRAPGTFTIDGWGPWHVRASRLYLCTIMDRYTRLAAVVPAIGGMLRDHRLGLTAEHWARAQVIAAATLLEPSERFERLYADNGIGMVPAGHVLTQGARTALQLGARLIFIPPAQPWRNGRLERFHWTMEREYFRAERPPSPSTAVSGLLEWLQFYNGSRPHSSLNYHAPGDRHPWRPLTEEMLAAPFDRLPVQEGIVEAVRMVLNSRLVELWGGEGLLVSPVLAGQFVRVIFQVPGPAPGRVVYQRKGEDLVVATFTHTLDAPGSATEQLLISAVRLVDFGGAVPPNQLLDEERLANQRGRVLKRRAGSLEDQLEGRKHAGASRVD